jgi:hypothetical protein
VDTFVGGAGGNIVYGTAATLNAGDSLTGGSGNNLLQLIGRGSFNLDQLAGFTGFKTIKVENATNTYANLILGGGQPTEIEATGYLQIFVNSPSHWNSSDIINGDPSRTWSSTYTYFYNNQSYPQSPVTYDLTANTFSLVNLSAGSDNISLIVNDLDTAGVQSFNAGGTNDRL